MEVHTRLEQFESECENIMACHGATKMADARQLRVLALREGVSCDAQAHEDDDDFCSEFTTPSRSSSTCLVGAVSIQPTIPFPEADFDSNCLGFFGDVGVNYLALSKGTPIREGIKVAKIEEVNENVLPWDT